MSSLNRESQAAALVAEAAREAKAERRPAAFRHRRWIPLALFLCDVSVLEISLWLGFEARQLANYWLPIDMGPAAYIGISAAVLVLPLAYFVMGLYPGYGLNDVERIRRQVGGTAIVFASLLAWDYLAQDGTWSRGIMLFTWAAATMLVPIAFAWLRKALIGAGLWGMPVAVLGAREPGERLVDALRREPKLGLVPVAVMDYDPSLTGTAVRGVPVVGTVADAPSLARRIRTCAVAMPELSGEQLAELSRRLPFPHVVLLPDFGGLPSAWVQARDLGGVLGLEVKKNLLLRHNRIVKRGMDFVIGAPLLAAALPLLLVLCAAIVAVSPGTPFYRQRREGAGGRPFGMLKLRTMYPDAEQRLRDHLAANPARRAEWNRYFKLHDDPRVLPWIGDFLRRSSLDELPQLVNVLRGEMSLVGPRPFPDYHLDAFDGPFRDLRRGVRPGLTGLWQVEARSNGDVTVQERFDTYYIRNWSVWLDFYILFKTVTAVVTGAGAR